MQKFVLRMRDTAGNEYWISPATYPCGRCPTSFDEAEIFPTQEAATRAIAEVPSFFSPAKVQFFVESFHSGTRAA